MYICDIYTVIFFRIEPRKGDYGEFFRKFKALEKIWEFLEDFENYNFDLELKVKQ